MRPQRAEETRNRQHETRRRARRCALVGLSALVTLTSPEMVGSLSLFTDTASTTADVTVGRLVLGLEPVSQSFTLMLAPGEALVAPVTVANDGNLPLRYSVRGVSDEDFLASRLTFTAKTGVTACTPAGYASSGTVVAGPVTAATTTGIDVLGDSTQGQQPGDRVLSPGAAETLCVQVELPASATGPYGDRATVITYTFTAEQTAHNP